MKFAGDLLKLQQIPGFPADKNSSSFPEYTGYPGVLDTVLDATYWSGEKLRNYSYLATT